MYTSTSSVEGISPPLLCQSWRSPRQTYAGRALAWPVCVSNCLSSRAARVRLSAIVMVQLLLVAEKSLSTRLARCPTGPAGGPVSSARPSCPSHALPGCWHKPSPRFTPHPRWVSIQSAPTRVRENTFKGATVMSEAVASASHANASLLSGNRRWPPQYNQASKHLQAHQLLGICQAGMLER